MKTTGGWRSVGVFHTRDVEVRLRVQRIQTLNFAALGSEEVAGLGVHSELYLSGRNGVGKSQLLLAIAMAARSEAIEDGGRHYIGPDGTKAEICVDFVLDDTEVGPFNDVASTYGVLLDEEEPVLRSRVELFVDRSSTQSWLTLDGDPSVGMVMSDQVARSKLPFTEVTYLPADRTVDRSEQLTLSLTSLSHAASLQVALQGLSQQLSEWGTGHHFDVFSSLAALHYAGVLSRGEGETSPALEDFFAIARAFERSTGKRLGEPSLRPDQSIGLDIALASGQKHPVSTLSSGELVALQLLHFVKLHYSRGSVLLIDEPEQHLHPSLQVEIANAVKEGTGAGQLWMATHSPNLLNAADGSSVLVLAADPLTGALRTSFADSNRERVELLGDLGVAPGLWVPGNFLVVVEGPTDEIHLRALLPAEFSRAFFVVAGSRSSVRSIENRMDTQTGFPSLAIVDRDRATDREVEDWNRAPHRFMWKEYAIESLFLDSVWLEATLSELDATWNRKRVDSELTRVFERQKSEAKAIWMREELERRVPSRDSHRSDLLKNSRRAVKVAEERLNLVENDGLELEASFEAAWAQNRGAFVNPKRALREFRQGLFAGTTALLSAMVARLNREPRLAPHDLVRLKEKIRLLTGEFAEPSEESQL